MPDSRVRVLSRAGAVCALAAGAIILAACSSSPTARSSETTTAGVSGSSSGTAGAAEVTTTSGPLGDFLVDGAGRTLYLFDADPEGTSGCYDQCAAAWPPLATNGDPTAGTGVTAKQLSTSTRTDGLVQVLYNGHPLYTYGQDTAPGQTNGQGSDQFGGMWFVVSAGGTAITPTSTASSAGSSSAAASSTAPSS